MDSLLLIRARLVLEMSKHKYTKKHHLYGTQAQLSPIQVTLRGTTKEDFEQAFRAFKKLVNNEKVLSLYKEKQAYEKPSVKKRRKRKESRERKMAMEAKQRLVASGEWEKRMKQRQERKKQRQEQKKKKLNDEDLL